MPKDPLAPDFGERINQYTAANLPPGLESAEADPQDDNAPPPDAGPARQRGLWE
jgi:hypothetical protein